MNLLFSCLFANSDWIIFPLYSQHHLLYLISVTYSSASTDFFNNILLIMQARNVIHCSFYHIEIHREISIVFLIEVLIFIGAVISFGGFIL